MFRNGKKRYKSVGVPRHGFQTFDATAESTKLQNLNDFDSESFVLNVNRLQLSTPKRSQEK